MFAGVAVGHLKANLDWDQGKTGYGEAMNQKQAICKSAAH